MEELLTLVTEYSPYALAALTVTTAVAHTLLPLARKFEEWAVVSTASWDDAPARKLVEALVWLVAVTSFIWSLLPRFSAGPTGAVRRPPLPPSGRAGGSVAVLALLFLGACSSGPQGSAQGSSAAPGCHWTITSGSEAPESGSPPTFALCVGEGCRVDLSCLFDRTSASPSNSQSGNRTETGDVAPSVSASGTGAASQ